MITTVSKFSKIKLYFFWFLLIVIPLAIVELASFIIIKLAYDSGEYRYRKETVANPYHPYLGYANAPNTAIRTSKSWIPKKTYIVTDKNGYSITPFSSFENPDLTIIVIGGSTIFGVGASDNSFTVPSVLERLINQKLKIRAEVINLALRGSQSFQEMLLVNRFLAAHKADLVLAVSGRNDSFFASVDPTVEGAFLQKRIWNEAVSLIHKAEKGEFLLVNFNNALFYSHTFDLLYRVIKNLKTPNLANTLSENNIQRRESTSVEQRAKITITHYSATAEICNVNKVPFIMFLQPTLYTKDFWTVDEEERILEQYESEDRIQEYRNKEFAFYNAYSAISKPFQFVDLSGTFSNFRETLYIDSCHYNDHASEKLSEKILESIESLLQRIIREKSLASQSN